MEPVRHSVDVSSRLAGIDFGTERSRIAIAAQLRNALAKLRTRRALLNQELTLLLADMGQIAVPDNPPADATKAKPEVVYSRLQQLFLAEAQRPDLDALLRERTALRAKISSWRNNAGCRALPNPEPPRLRTNWDVVLEEMRWVADDIARDQSWRRTCSATIARHAAAAVLRMAVSTRLDVGARQTERWLRARSASKAISGFWATVSRLQTMERSRAPVELLVRRRDPHSAAARNDLALDTNPINEYLRAGHVPAPHPVVAGESPAVDIDQLVALRNALVQLRFDDAVPELNGPLCCTTLAQHQRQCVAWFESVSTTVAPPASFILVDDEGLGKRIAVMAWIALQDASVQPHLIVTSALNLLRWDSEFRCRFPSGPSPILYTNRELWPVELASGAVVIASFEMALHDMQIASRTWRSVVVDMPRDADPDFGAPRWATLVRVRADVRILLARHLDAALRSDQRRTQMSALAFIAPNTFSDLSDLDEALSQYPPVPCDGILGHDFLNAFCLRRTRDQVQDSLSDCRDVLVPVSLSVRQASLYGQQTPVETPGSLQELIRIVARLHVICTHPDLLEPWISRRPVLFEVDPLPHTALPCSDRRPAFRAVSLRLLQSFIESVLSWPAAIDLDDRDAVLDALRNRNAIDAARTPCPIQVTRSAHMIDSLFENSFSLRILRGIFVPCAIARRPVMERRRYRRKDTYLDIAEPCFRDHDSAKLLALFGLLRQLYRPAARIALIASSSRALDVLQHFLRRHRFRHVREPPVPTVATVQQFAKAIGSWPGPLIYLTSSRTMAVFAYPSPALFTSVIVFDHDWDRTCRRQLEDHFTAGAGLADFRLYRFVLRDTVDDDAFKLFDADSDDAYYDRLLLGLCSELPFPVNAREAELMLLRSEAPVDLIALNVWRRSLLNRAEIDSGPNPYSSGPDLSYLLRPIELWALRRNPAEIISDPIVTIRDPLRVISPSSLPSAPEDVESVTVSNSLPPDAQLALVVARPGTKQTFEDGSVLPAGVMIATSASTPVLFYKFSRRIPLETQLRRFARRFKLAMDFTVKGPPAPLIADQRFSPLSLGDDDPNDPLQWGLFATTESQTMMFRAWSGTARRRKKKMLRRGPRLATVLVNGMTGAVRIRIAKKQLVASAKRKADDVAEVPVSKRPRPDQASAPPTPAPPSRPITLTHPVPFSDDEDALLVCSAVLFGANFQIATNVLESDLAVRGRLRTPKLCADRFALLVRKVKEVGPRLWDRLQADSNASAPVPPLPNATDSQLATRHALDWLRYRSQVRNKVAAEKTFNVISGAARAVMQAHMQCKLALRTPLSGVSTEAFKEALMRSHASHAAALTAGHKRLMIPHANIGSTLSPRQIVELRALRDRTHESKKMSAMAPPQQIASPSIRSAKMSPAPVPSTTTPLMRTSSVPLAMSPVIMPPLDGGVTLVASNGTQPDLDQVHGEIDQGNMFLLRQLVQKQPHVKARLVQILQRPDLNQTQKMEMAAALFNSDGANNTGATLDEAPIAT